MNKSRYDGDGTPTTLYNKGLFGSGYLNIKPTVNLCV